MRPFVWPAASAARMARRVASRSRVRKAARGSGKERWAVAITSPKGDLPAIEHLSAYFPCERRSTWRAVPADGRLHSSRRYQV